MQLTVLTKLGLPGGYASACPRQLTDGTDWLRAMQELETLRRRPPTLVSLERTTGFEPATLALARSQHSFTRSSAMFWPAVQSAKSSNRYGQYQPVVDRSTKLIASALSAIDRERTLRDRRNRLACEHRHVAPVHGTISNASRCEGRTTVKSRRSRRVTRPCQR